MTSTDTPETIETIEITKITLTETRTPNPNARFAASEGRDMWQNPSLPPAVDEQGRLCDAYGNPYPPEVQRLRALILPTLDMSTDLLLRDAIVALKHWESAKPVVYACAHCRDGKDLPRGYMCERCGTDNSG